MRRIWLVLQLVALVVVLVGLETLPVDKKALLKTREAFEQEESPSEYDIYIEEWAKEPPQLPKRR